MSLCRTIPSFLRMRESMSTAWRFMQWTIDRYGQALTVEIKPALGTTNEGNPCTKMKRL